MTGEEIQKTIEQMLAVQKELQESQIRLKDQQERERETISILVEEIFKLVALNNQHENRINQLIGYSITEESDRLTLMERLMRVEQRLEQLENQQNEN
ncbi:hypothetical protein C7H19_20380 [Aphanothece hegewaldii CCALA 016]|uniref:Uncharacterized protein n=1 Tax=Aphanothece hegewaldii CCALA 016 TaxID=2107694 RepID=A0A2T1LSV7_9CHRO|nr:hypothetical protein [Aphanothece hegewaldii]PSF33165.1 hypothetical protein C7H19_20380 [Aphanothece hegewaldii CCALA 016]